MSAVCSVMVAAGADAGAGPTISSAGSATAQGSEALGAGAAAAGNTGGANGMIALDAWAAGAGWAAGASAGAGAGACANNVPLPTRGFDTESAAERSSGVTISARAIAQMAPWRPLVRRVLHEEADVQQPPKRQLLIVSAASLHLDGCGPCPHGALKRGARSTNMWGRA